MAGRVPRIKCSDISQFKLTGLRSEPPVQRFEKSEIFARVNRKARTLNLQFGLNLDFGDAAEIAVLLDVPTHMLAREGIIARLRGKTLEHAAAHRIDAIVEAGREKRRLDIVRVTLDQGLYEPVRKAGIDQRRIGIDANDHISLVEPCRIDEARENVQFGTAKKCDPFVPSKLDDGVILRGRRCRDHNVIEHSAFAQPMHDMKEQGPTGKRQQDLAGQPGRTHARLHNSYDALIALA